MIRTLRTFCRAMTNDAESARFNVGKAMLACPQTRDAKAATQYGQQTCATLMARRSAERKRLEALCIEIEDRKSQLRAVIAADQTDLAEEIADRIVTLESHKTQAQAAIADLDHRIGKVRSNLSSADKRIAALAANLRIARV